MCHTKPYQLTQTSHYAPAPLSGALYGHMRLSVTRWRFLNYCTSWYETRSRPSEFCLHYNTWSNHRAVTVDYLRRINDCSPVMRYSQSLNQWLGNQADMPRLFCADMNSEVRSRSRESACPANSQSAVMFFTKRAWLIVSTPKSTNRRPLACILTSTDWQVDFIVLQQTLVSTCIVTTYCLTFWKFKSIHACSVTTTIASI